MLFSFANFNNVDINIDEIKDFMKTAEENNSYNNYDYDYDDYYNEDYDPSWGG